MDKLPARTCIYPGCGRKHEARGWCRLHYGRWLKHGDPAHKRLPARERFWKFVDKRADDACWPWVGRTDIRGYGQFRVGDAPRPAPRVSYQIHFGDIPEGMYVCHACDEPGCVNPAHLFLGSPRDNAVDMVNKRRHRFGERSPFSKLVPDDVRAIRGLYPGVPVRELSERFGVATATIYKILRREKWKHV